MVTSYISMLESSPKSPNLEILFVLAEALGAKPSEPIFAMESFGRGPFKSLPDKNVTSGSSKSQSRGLTWPCLLAYIVTVPASNKQP